ncbi:MAG: multidrug efflux SMR transporter [Salinisphaeraceae bacterium]|nr:multidrug efflux SMR transporter [Salinisphaeraceae bacterium]
MAWWYLLIAGVFEWGWPLGLKFAWRDGQFFWWPAMIALVSMSASGYFLFLAQREIPVGTAYAVWTGIGAVGTFLLGIWLLGEVASVSRFFFLGLIIIGIAGLKFS